MTNAATQQQLAATPTHVRLKLDSEPDFPKALTGKPIAQLTEEDVAALPEGEKLAWLAGHLQGYSKGREMKLVVEVQRSDLLHAMERILAVDSPDAAQEIARAAIDRVRAETDAALDA